MLKWCENGNAKSVKSRMSDAEGLRVDFSRNNFALLNAAIDRGFDSIIFDILRLNGEEFSLPRELLQRAARAKGSLRLMKAFLAMEEKGQLDAHVDDVLPYMAEVSELEPGLLRRLRRPAFFSRLSKGLLHRLVMITISRGATEFVVWLIGKLEALPKGCLSLALSGRNLDMVKALFLHRGTDLREGDFGILSLVLEKMGSLTPFKQVLSDPRVKDVPCRILETFMESVKDEDRNVQVCTVALDSGKFDLPEDRVLWSLKHCRNAMLPVKVRNVMLAKMLSLQNDRPLSEAVLVLALSGDSGKQRRSAYFNFFAPVWDWYKEHSDKYPVIFPLPQLLRAAEANTVSEDVLRGLLAEGAVDLDRGAQALLDEFLKGPGKCAVALLRFMLVDPRWAFDAAVKTLTALKASVRFATTTDDPIGIVLGLITLCDDANYSSVPILVSDPAAVTAILSSEKAAPGKISASSFVRLLESSCVRYFSSIWCWLQQKTGKKYPSDALLEAAHKQTLCRSILGKLIAGGGVDLEACGAKLIADFAASDQWDNIVECYVSVEDDKRGRISWRVEVLESILSTGVDGRRFTDFLRLLSAACEDPRVLRKHPEPVQRLIWAALAASPTKTPFFQSFVCSRVVKQLFEFLADAEELDDEGFVEWFCTQQKDPTPVDLVCDLVEVPRFNGWIGLAAKSLGDIHREAEFIAELRRRQYDCCKLSKEAQAQLDDYVPRELEERLEYLLSHEFAAFSMPMNVLLKPEEDSFASSAAPCCMRLLFFRAVL